MRQDNPNNAACKLVEMAAELLRVAASMSTSKAAESTPKYLTTAEALATYGMGKTALDARGIPRVKRGRAWVWSVADIEQHLATNAAPKPPRKTRQITSVNEDPIDQMLAAGELRRTR